MSAMDFQCNKEGHISRDCPEQSARGGRSGGGGGGGGSRACYKVSLEDNNEFAFPGF